MELKGYEAEPGLSPDSYRITLAGDGEAGPFGGITRAPGELAARQSGLPGHRVPAPLAVPRQGIRLA